MCFHIKILHLFSFIEILLLKDKNKSLSELLLSLLKPVEVTQFRRFDQSKLFGSQCKSLYWIVISCYPNNNLSMSMSEKWGLGLYSPQRFFTHCHWRRVWFLIQTEVFVNQFQSHSSGRSINKSFTNSKDFTNCKVSFTAFSCPVWIIWDIFKIPKLINYCYCTFFIHIQVC